MSDKKWNSRANVISVLLFLTISYTYQYFGDNVSFTDTIVIGIAWLVGHTIT